MLIMAKKSDWLLGEIIDTVSGGVCQASP